MAHKPKDPSYQKGSLFERMLKDPILRRKIQRGWAKMNEESRALEQWARRGFLSGREQEDGEE